MARLLASFYDFGVPIIIGVVLYWSNRKLHRQGEPANEARRRSSFRLLAIGVLLFGLLRWGFSFVIGPTPFQSASENRRLTPPNERLIPSIEELEGDMKDGEYQNGFFRLRLPFRPGWESLAEQEVVRQRKSLPNGAMGFCITKRHGDDNTKTLLVQFTIEGNSIGSSELVGSHHLESVRKQLESGPRPPTKATFAAHSTFAGIRFDRLDVRRPLGDGDIGLTVFATVLRGHPITFVCWYSTEELPEETLNLLNGMSRIASPTITK